MAGRSSGGIIFGEVQLSQFKVAGIQNKQLAMAKAYQMRLVLQDIYRSPEAGPARRRFQVWCRWVRWVARFHKPSLFGSMVKLAQMIERHLAGILANWKWGVTNAFMEGLNSVLIATKRKARGHPSTTHLITMLVATYEVSSIWWRGFLGVERNVWKPKVNSPGAMTPSSNATPEPWRGLS